MTPHEIDDKYPVRYGAWMFDRMTGRWIAEDSTLRGAPKFLDPWDRPFPSDKNREVYDPRGKEIAGWIYQTSVAGTPVECVVFND